MVYSRYTVYLVYTVQEVSRKTERIPRKNSFRCVPRVRAWFVPSVTLRFVKVPILDDFQYINVRRIWNKKIVPENSYELLE